MTLTKSVVRFTAPAMLVFAFFLLVTSQAKTLLLDDSDDNSHVCLYVGDTMTIKLVANPSTGFSWSKPEGGAQLKLLSTTDEKGPAERVGSSGFQIFTLKVIKVGESTLTLNYLRPFEKDTPPAKTFHLSFTIKERPAGKT